MSAALVVGYTVVAAVTAWLIARHMHVWSDDPGEVAAVGTVALLLGVLWPALVVLAALLVPGYAFARLARGRREETQQ